MFLRSETFTRAVREAVAISAVDLVFAVAASALLPVDRLAVFGLAMLVEGALLMLVGGALSFVEGHSAQWVSRVVRKGREFSPEDVRKHRSRATLYTLTGVLLFLGSMVLSAFSA